MGEKSEKKGSYGEERIIVVGLPDAAVRESVDRVSTALTSIGEELSCRSSPRFHGAHQLGLSFAARQNYHQSCSGRSTQGRAKL